MKKEEVFVFGSNLAGIHGAGAAKTAKRKYGAKQGQGIGLQGRSYGIPTKDKYLRTLPLNTIQIFVKEFLLYAKANPNIKFYLTAIGTGLAGYKASDIAPMFKDATPNITLPLKFQQKLGDPHG